MTEFKLICQGGLDARTRTHTKTDNRRYNYTVAVQSRVNNNTALKKGCLSPSKHRMFHHGSTVDIITTINNVVDKCTYY